MKSSRKTSKDFEKIGMQIIDRFKRTSLEGRRKFLAKLDGFIAAENDAELLEVWKEFKSILEGKNN